jgi:DNA-binding phage protein
MALETTLWDPEDSLVSPEAEIAYLDAALKDGDPALIVAVISDIARARATRADRPRVTPPPLGSRS